MRVLSANKIVAGGLGAFAACGGDLAETPGTLPWTLNPAVASAGEGNPLCEKAIAGVVDVVRIYTRSCRAKGS